MNRYCRYHLLPIQSPVGIFHIAMCDSWNHFNCWMQTTLFFGCRYAPSIGKRYHPARVCVQWGLTASNRTGFLPTTHWTYTFSAKERDPETGLSYFGSRYYSCDLSIWLSVDPMNGKYPSLSPYVYCSDNPVKLVDPNGEEIGDYYSYNG